MFKDFMMQRQLKQFWNSLLRMADPFPLWHGRPDQELAPAEANKVYKQYVYILMASKEENHFDK